MSTEQFQHALSRVVNDESYRNALRDKPNQIVEDFDLSQDEIDTLVTVGRRAEGTDVEGYEFIACCCTCCP